MSKFDVDKMLELYRLGHGCNYIAEALGCSVNTVAHHIERICGLRPAKRIDWPIEQMRVWYEQDGKTLREIADLLGQSSKAVNKVAKRNGFQMRPRGQKFGSQHKGWKGGKTIDKSGYVLLYRPDHPDSNSNGYIREHRLVMEAKIGRRLLSTEVVHHIDGSTDNNHPDNLELFDSNGKHLSQTLRGCCPNWTQDGFSRVVSNCRLNAQRRSIQNKSRQDGFSSP